MNQACCSLSLRYPFQDLEVRHRHRAPSTNVLLNSVAGNYQYLSDNSGLIQRSEERRVGKECTG
jgi:hypothetical protein